MQLYYSKTYSDQEGTGEEAKFGMLFGSKHEILKICNFFEEVKEYLMVNDKCHMHLRDNYSGWIMDRDFDLEVTVD